jgi:PAS domain-containing protein
MIVGIAGLATVLLAGLAGFLIYEIGRRTAQEIALAEEHSRLQADIALRQEVEHQQRAAQQTLRDAVDSISEGFVIYDRDDCFVMCNDAHRRLYPEGARLMVPGTRFEEIVWAGLDAGRYVDAIGCEPEWLADRMHAHDHPAMPLEQRLADGRWVMVCERRMENGGSAELHIDITDLKTIEDQLRRSRDNLNRAQRRAKIGSFERDLRTGEVFWSDEIYRIFGRGLNTPPPTHGELLSIIDSEDRASFEASMTASEKGLATPPFQFRIHCPDGSLKWVFVEAEVMLDHFGNPIRRVGTIKDVTEARAAEERQRQLESQLFHSQKLEALGTLAGGIAHDLNNTLMTILALSELLIRARLGQAAATNPRRNVSAPGAGSLAATVSPRARNTAVQLAPIVPVPIAATRRMLSAAIHVPFRPARHLETIPRHSAARLRRERARAGRCSVFVLLSRDELVAEFVHLAVRYDSPVPAPTAVQPSPPFAAHARANPYRGSLAIACSSQAERLEVTGPITPQLWIASDVPDRNFPVKLIDVYPSGAVFAFPRGKPQPGRRFPDLAENFEPNHPSSANGSALWQWCGQANLRRCGNLLGRGRPNDESEALAGSLVRPRGYGGEPSALTAAMAAQASAAARGSNGPVRRP